MACETFEEFEKKYLNDDLSNGVTDQLFDLFCKSECFKNLTKWKESTEFLAKIYLRSPQLFIEFYYYYQSKCVENEDFLIALYVETLTNQIFRTGFYEATDEILRFINDLCDIVCDSLLSFNTQIQIQLIPNLPKLNELVGLDSLILQNLLFQNINSPNPQLFWTLFKTSMNICHSHKDIVVWSQALYDKIVLNPTKTTPVDLEFHIQNMINILNRDFSIMSIPVENVNFILDGINYALMKLDWSLLFNNLDDFSGKIFFLKVILAISCKQINDRIILNQLKNNFVRLNNIGQFGISTMHYETLLNYFVGVKYGEESVVDSIGNAGSVLYEFAEIVSNNHSTFEPIFVNFFTDQTKLVQRLQLLCLFLEYWKEKDIFLKKPNPPFLLFLVDLLMAINKGYSFEFQILLQILYKSLLKESFFQQNFVQKLVLNFRSFLSHLPQSIDYQHSQICKIILDISLLLADKTSFPSLKLQCLVNYNLMKHYLSKEHLPIIQFHKLEANQSPLTLETNYSYPKYKSLSEQTDWDSLINEILLFPMEIQLEYKLKFKPNVEEHLKTLYLIKISWNKSKSNHVVPLMRHSNDQSSGYSNSFSVNVQSIFPNKLPIEISFNDCNGDTYFFNSNQYEDLDFKHLAMSIQSQLADSSSHQFKDIFLKLTNSMPFENVERLLEIPQSQLYIVLKRMYEEIYRISIPFLEDQTMYLDAFRVFNNGLFLIEQINTVNLFESKFKLYISSNHSSMYFADRFFQILTNFYSQLIGYH